MRTVGGEQRGRIGADGEEGDKTEVEKPGEPNLEIETHAHQDVEPDQQHHLTDIGTGHDRKQHQKEDEQDGARSGAIALPDQGGASEPIMERRPKRVCPQQRAAAAENEDRRGADGAEPLPSINRLAQVADQRAVLHHDLDEFLKDAEDRHKGEADEHRFAHSHRRQRERGAEPGQHCRSEGQENWTGRDAEAEGQLLLHSRGKRDEDRAKVDDLHRHGQQCEESPCDGAGEKARQGERPEFGGLPARGDCGAGAERDPNQRGVAERHDVDDDPAPVEQRQDADDSDVDGHDAENETDSQRSREDGALLPTGAVDRTHRRLAHARFFAIRSPSMP